MSLHIQKVIDPKELNTLLGKTASYGQLHFEFSPKLLEALSEHLTAKNAYQFLMKKDDQVAGYVAALEDLFPGFIRLEELFVDPAFQGQGIGQQLVEKVIATARTIDGIQGVMTETEFENLPAQRLYEKCGFVRVHNPNWQEGITYQLIFK